MKMCIVIIIAIYRPDSNPPASLFQPSHLFNGSICHAHNGKIAALIRVGHQVNSFVFSFAAVVSFRLPGILEGDRYIWGQGRIRYRKIDKLFPDRLDLSLILLQKALCGLGKAFCLPVYKIFDPFFFRLNQAAEEQNGNQIAGMLSGNAHKLRSTP